MPFLALAQSSIQLVPDGTLLLHVALVLLMIFILNRTLFRPVLRVLEDREKRTRTGTGSAQQTLMEVERKMLSYEASLREARAQSYQLLEQEHNAALQDRQERLNALRADLAKLSEAEKDSIRAQTEQSRGELNREAARIAEQISVSILGRPTRGV